MLNKDSDYFLALQTQTGWSRTLARFVEWCAPQTGWRTLDVGCGPGLLPALLTRSGCQAIGVDLDPGMFVPEPVHPDVAIADGLALPFPAGCFDLVTAVNVLFLSPEPVLILRECGRLLRMGGKVAVLNPSEHMTVEAASELVSHRGLTGLARETMLNWATRAEAYHRWTADDLQAIFAAAGLRMTDTTLRIRPGLARLSCGTPF